jgi:hypothetical protein
MKRKGDNESTKPRCKKVASGAAVSVARLRPLAECPVCRGLVPDAPLYQCCRGHILCAPCLERLPTNRCPTCRGKYDRPASRNLIAEHLRDDDEIDFEFNCKHAAIGCSFKGDRREAKEHAAGECPFRKVPCPHPKCSALVELCNLMSHLKVAHPKGVYDHKSSGEGVFKNKLWTSSCFNATEAAWTVNAGQYDGQTFFLGCRKEKGLFHLWVSVANGAATASKYEARICIGGDKMSVRHQAKVFPIDLRQEDIWQHDECSSLTDKTVRHCVKAQKPRNDATDREPWMHVNFEMYMV